MSRLATCNVNRIQRYCVLTCNVKREDGQESKMLGDNKSRRRKSDMTNMLPCDKMRRKMSCGDMQQ